MTNAAGSFRQRLIAVGDGLLTAVIVLGVIGLVGATALVCLGLLLSGALAGEGSIYPPSTTVGWIQELSWFASGRVCAAATLGVFLVIATVVAVVGARRRSGVSMWVGLVCGTMIASTLLVLSADARPRLDGIAESALDAARREIGATPPQTLPPTSEPTPAGSPPLALTTAHDEMRAMLRATRDAAGTAALDESGTELLADDLPLTASACGESGTALAAVFAVRPAEGDAAAAARMLDAWTAAGYSADRAMQEDIRYSIDLAVEVMRLRDTTTIDGLVHLTVQGRCASGE